MSTATAIPTAFGYSIGNAPQEPRTLETTAILGRFGGRCVLVGTRLNDALFSAHLHTTNGALVGAVRKNRDGDWEAVNRKGGIVGEPQPDALSALTALGRLVYRSA